MAKNKGNVKAWHKKNKEYGKTYLKRWIKENYDGSWRNYFLAHPRTAKKVGYKNI